MHLGFKFFGYIHGIYMWDIPLETKETHDFFEFIADPSNVPKQESLLASWTLFDYHPLVLVIPRSAVKDKNLCDVPFILGSNQQCPANLYGMVVNIFCFDFL